MRDLLNQYDFPGDDTPVVRLSALQALESTSTDQGAPEYEGHPASCSPRWTSTFPIPDRPRDLPFLMPIEDVFSIKGRGTVVTGRIERGVVHPGDEVEIVGFGADKKTTVTGVEMFHKLLDEGEPGDAVGTLLRGVERDDVERGQVLAAPRSIKSLHEADAEVYVLSKNEGGRHTPFFSGYKPQFYVRTMDVTGEIELPEGTEMIMPGDNTRMRIKLITPVAMEEGLRFAIREGGRTVGAGVVTKVY